MSQNYDNVAHPYADYKRRAVTEWSIGYPAVVAALEPLEGKHILDHGCGGGDFGRVLADRGARVVGVDISTEMISNAARAHAAAQMQFHSIQPGGKCVILNTNWEECNGADFASFRLNKTETLLPGSTISLVLKSTPPVELFDYFWSKQNYPQFLHRAGFVNISVADITYSSPSSKHNSQWLDELNMSPFFLVTANVDK